MTMKHEMPAFVVEWYDMRDNPPKCCHTCEFYRYDGVCTQFDMRPPEDFAATIDQCDKWEMECPF